MLKMFVMPRPWVGGDGIHLGDDINELIFLQNVPGAMFIPGATSIPESRVVVLVPNAFELEWQLK